MQASVRDLKRESLLVNFKRFQRYFVWMSNAHPNWVLIIAVFLLYLPMLSQKFWLIDDHEIVWFLSKLREDGLLGFWNQWSQISDFGWMPRFRPVYYFLRALEILVWRDNPLLWVAARFGIACFFTIRIYWLFRKISPHFISLLLALSMLGVPWFSEVFGRFGPAETYAMLFIALLLQSVFPKSGRVHWLSAVVCIAMLVGIKENFYALIPVQLLAVAMLIRDDKKHAAIVASGFVLLSTACVAILAYKMYWSASIDIYNQGVGAGRIKEAMHNLYYSIAGWASFLIVISCFYAISMNKLGFSKRVSWVVFGICIATLGFNIYFYSGPPHINSRYAVPYWPILLGMLAISCAHAFKANIFKTLNSALPVMGRLIVVVFALGISALIVRNVLFMHRHASATVRVDKAIAEIMERSKNVDEIVVRASGSDDYEPVFSISRFLKYRQMGKPLFLSVNKDTVGMNSGDIELTNKLLKSLGKVELNGGQGYQPVANRISPARCLEIVFHNTASSVCSERVYVQY